MNGILLSCIVENIATRRDGTIKVTLGTQELSNGKAGDLFALNGKLAAIYISPKDTIPQKELDQVDAVDVDMPGKTQSQRMRGVLFILFEQNNEGFKDFQSYYRVKMDDMIKELKNNIL
jgi:hypothetical protein